MTIAQVLQRVDDLKPNQLSAEQKIEWLSQLDRKYFEEIIKTHEKDQGTPDSFAGYENETDQNTMLLIQDPYSEVYQWYLYMQIDLANQEMDKYNNSLALYETAWGANARRYNREHMPIQRAKTWKF